MSGNLEPTVGALTFTDNISIDWKCVEHLPDDSRLAVVNESNESFLRAVSAIGAFSTELSEEDVTITQEIARNPMT